MIELRSVSNGHERRPPARLHPISLTVRTEQRLAILGRQAAGVDAARAVAGLDSPSAAAMIDGVTSRR